MARTKILKSSMSPEAWAARMARQRERRSDPAIRAAELASDRSRWPQRKAKRAPQMSAWAKANLARINERQKRLRSANPERFRQRQRACYRRDPSKTINRQRKYAAEISPSYIAANINLPVSAIPADFITLYQAHLTLKRELKTK